MCLKFSGLVWNPFLHNNFDLVILQYLGKSPEEMEVLHISVIGFTSIFTPFLKNLPEILSIPAVFEMSIYFKISKTFLVKVILKLSFSFIFCNIGEHNSNQICYENLEDS